MSLTHLEVRRHPLWRQELAAHGRSPARRHGWNVLVVSGIALAALTVLAAISIAFR